MKGKLQAIWGIIRARSYYVAVFDNKRRTGYHLHDGLIVRNAEQIVMMLKSASHDALLEQSALDQVNKIINP